MTIAEFTLILPEVFLALSAMALLLFGVLKDESKQDSRFESWCAIAALGLSLFIGAGFNTDVIAFNGQFVVDPFASFMKILIALSAIVALIYNLHYTQSERLKKFEYSVLVLFAVTGMNIMVSANDLMALYLGLELQSLSLYVMAALERSKLKPSEAGLKYFILGAVTSGILLFGCSLVYGFAGSTQFTDISSAVQLAVSKGPEHSIGLLTGAILILIALFFKVSAVPFHMWTPDVYEGVPKPVVAFFATAPKMAALGLLIRFVFEPFSAMVSDFNQIFVVVAAVTMVLGSFTAIRQTNIKRLMAYSSIGHFGFILVGFAAGTQEAVSAILLYAVIYLFMNLGVFGCIMLMTRSEEHVEDIRDLAGMGKSHPLLACVITILMLSMAGIPPLAGFFGKFFIFSAAISAGLYTLAIIGVLASVVGAFYYIRIIKIMYFDESDIVLDKGVTANMQLLLAISATFNVIYFISPTTLLITVGNISRVLF